MDKQIIIIYNDEEYNITDFINNDEHPGGNEIINELLITTNDITTEFNNIGHSKSAIRLLNKYKIKNILINDDKIINEKQDKTIIKKLFTHEDNFNIHKTLGFFSILSFIYRYLYLLPKFNDLLMTKSLFNYLILINHLLLTSTSILFHIINKRSNIDLLLIWKEYRLHSIIFTLKSIIVTIFGLYQYEIIKIFGIVKTKILLLIVVLLHLILVDLITIKYGTLGITTVRNNSKTENENIITKYGRLYYSFYQIVAAASHLELDKNLANYGYNTLIAIQSSAFLMTLNKKNIINNYGHIIGYSLSLLLSYYYIFLTKDINFMIQVITIAILRFTFNINKYILWICFSLLNIYLNKK